MKKLLIFSFVLLGMLSVSFANEYSKKDPMAYNDEIVNYYNTLDTQIADIIDAIYDSTKTIEDLQKEINYANAIVEMNLPKLKKMKKLKKDHGFLEETIKFYEIAQALLETKYQEIMDIYNSPTEWSDEKGKRVDELSNQIIDEVAEQEDVVIKAQSLFAEEYQITLLD
jgi:dGTP triphosphohydrolase